jgi:hypothetical protein
LLLRYLEEHNPPNATSAAAGAAAK